jgi:hypothetical protein
MCIHPMSPEKITIGCKTLHMETQIQTKLPPSHAYIPKAHIYLVT